MTPDEIKSVLDLHLLWRNKKKGGTRADLSRANLYKANLSEANLSWANLSRANLSWADLSRANLSGANLYRVNLSEANLSGANLEFLKLPSIKMLASFYLGKLSDVLTLELMRRDAWAHPKPEAFDAWANGCNCPYQNEDRFWLFELKKELWNPGPPEMRDSDLILAICRERGWKVTGYIE